MRTKVQKLRTVAIVLTALTVAYVFFIVGSLPMGLYTKLGDWLYIIFAVLFFAMLFSWMFYQDAKELS